MIAIPVEELELGGLNAPVRTVETLNEFEAVSELGAMRYRHSFQGGEHLDALLLVKKSDTLVVSLHGALERGQMSPPRFERLRMLSDLPVSSMYFADPALWRHPGLQLAWFTGWNGFDLQQVVASWTVAAARAIGASRIVFTGSSGGGFAALQVSALIPDSLAVPFNPQTSIHGYLADAQRWGPQHDFRSRIWPELADIDNEPVPHHVDWTLAAGDRMSALRRYSSPTKNHVFMVINNREFHYNQHFLPFLGAAALGGNLGRVTHREYMGGTRHNPPPPEIFRKYTAEALDFVRDLPLTIPG